LILFLVINNFFVHILIKMNFLLIIFEYENGIERILDKNSINIFCGWEWNVQYLNFKFCDRLFKSKQETAYFSVFYELSFPF